MSARPSRAKAAPTTYATDGPIPDQLIDDWRGARTDRASIGAAYTPAIDLYRDFQRWHEAAHPDLPVPTEGAFVRALRFVPKILFKIMEVSRPFEGKRMATCANLSLRAPLRSVA